MTALGKPLKILILDDDVTVTRYIGPMLIGEGFRVEVLNNPLEVMGALQAFEPDVLLLDGIMPEMNGVQVLKLIRFVPQYASLPIGLLLEEKETQLRLEIAQMGEDLVISKPISKQDLIFKLKRIKADCRERSSVRGLDNHVFRVGNIEVDTLRYASSVNNSPVSLTPTEFKLLKLLIERRGRVQTREHLLNHVWDYASEVETRTIDTHIRRLREKLGNEGSVIKTVRGIGYTISDN